jgi:hypothetical protein
MIQELLQKLLAQVLSGKWIATVIVVSVYAYCACNGTVQPDKIQEITLIVLYAYFTKQTEPKNPIGQ